MNKMYRQGDILLIQVYQPDLGHAQEIPRENGKVVLAHGEATGHTHAIDSHHAILYQVRDRIIVSLTENAILSHEEHEPIHLPVGSYEVIQQREYLTSGGWSHVLD